MKILEHTGLLDLKPTTSIPPGEYSNSWFDAHIPYWELLLVWSWEQRADHGGLNFLEIGCYEGRSAAWLLHNLVEPADASVTLVDPWGPGPEWQPIYEQARRNLEPIVAKTTPRVTIHRTTSAEFWPQSPLSFDFIYIDGSHKAEDVMADLTQAWASLRSGGIILVDDYYNPATPPEERREVGQGLIERHRYWRWPWPPAQYGVDVLYQKV